MGLIETSPILLKRRKHSLRDYGCESAYVPVIRCAGYVRSLSRCSLAFRVVSTIPVNTVAGPVSVSGRASDKEEPLRMSSRTATESAGFCVVRAHEKLVFF